jgi:hypothetical protein
MLDTLNQQSYPTENWQFDTELVPLQIENGTIVNSHKALIRTDTEEVLAVHGNGYHIISHDDVVNSTYDALKQADISSDYEFKVIDYDNGRKLKIDIIFPNLIVEPVVGDHIRFQTQVFNSYDASWSLSQQAKAFRLWCMNGCTTPDTISHQRTKHTKNGSLGLDAGASLMKQGLEQFYNDKDMWTAYTKQPITWDAVENFFKETLTRTSRRYRKHNEFNKRQLENLLSIHHDQVNHLGHNAWAAYNTMTQWATHTGDCAVPENAQRQRSDAVAKAMRSDIWRTLTNA